MKFKKKPVEVEAVQWFKIGDHPNVYMYCDKNSADYLLGNFDKVPWIDTLEGGHVVSAGDWIITGVNGELYPCKPDIFEKTYQASGGQESEAQAVARIEGDDTQRRLMWENIASFDFPVGTKLYAAPTSALAIETAAKRQAAEVLDASINTAHTLGNAEELREAKARILATIPQDGITALEEFGMRVAEAIEEAVMDGTGYSTRAIVSSLIGEK